MIELAAYTMAAREWYRPCRSTPFTYEDLAAFESLEPPFAPGDLITDKSGGRWVVVSQDVGTGRYRVRPNVAFNDGLVPTTGYSPFQFAPRGMWAGAPTWLAEERELLEMSRLFS